MSHPIEHIPRLLEEVAAVKEMLLANAVMCGEIPAPTFAEENRMVFVRDRFTEAGLHNISVDEAGNVAGILPGAGGQRRILLSANLDTVFPAETDHAMSVGPDYIRGPGICDNSLGLGTLATLPSILEKFGQRLESDLILLASTRSLGEGDLGGIRFFLDNYTDPIDQAICLRGGQLGRLSYASLGMLRASIDVLVPEQTDWKNVGDINAIASLNRLISRLLAIPLPSDPPTSIVLGSVRSGNSYNSAPARATLRFEVRSEGETLTDEIEETINEIVDEMSAETNVVAQLNVISRRRRGGISFTHPLVRTVREILSAMEIRPIIAPSTGELCALIDHDIPAVTVGLTMGEHLHEANETVRIAPLFRGLTQVLTLLQSIDEGHCDE